LKELYEHGRNGAIVVLFSPRRFGKTSLVKKVQRKLERAGAIPVYVDFYGVPSTEDVARRLAAGLFDEVRAKTLRQKALELFSSVRPMFTASVDPVTGAPIVKFGFGVAPSRVSRTELLEDVMRSIGRFIDFSGKPLHIVLDEFQEITTLPDAAAIEGLLRAHIQRHEASYFFVGSRRRLLQAMFTDAHRPFFRSSLLYPLSVLPAEAFARFLSRLSAKAGKPFPLAVSRRMVEAVEAYPYYGQKLAYFAFSEAEKKITNDTATRALEALLREEGLHFQGELTHLTSVQKRLLYDLAEGPVEGLFTKEGLLRTGISLGGIQKARRVLVDLDFIEETEAGWKVVDPVLRMWLARQP
jgi:AAA+ ATPase superfamily predicted ATPase